MSSADGITNQDMLIYNKLELKYTNKLIIYDAIAGKDYPEYDDFVILFVKNIMDVFRYIQLLYPYPFTGAHNFSWQPEIHFDTILNLKYIPLYPSTYFDNMEIYQKFIKPIYDNQIHNLSLSSTANCCGDNPPISFTPLPSLFI